MQIQQFFQYFYSYYCLKSSAQKYELKLYFVDLFDYIANIVIIFFYLKTEWANEQKGVLRSCVPCILPRTGKLQKFGFTVASLLTCKRSVGWGVDSQNLLDWFISWFKSSESLIIIIGSIHIFYYLVDKMAFHHFHTNHQTFKVFISSSF